MWWHKKKEKASLTVEKLLKMSRQEIGALTVEDYKPVDVVWMLLEHIKVNGE